MALQSSPYLIFVFAIVGFMIYLLIAGSLSSGLAFILAMLVLVLLFLHGTTEHDATIKEAEKIAYDYVKYRQDKGWDVIKGNIEVMREVGLRWLLAQAEKEDKRSRTSHYSNEFARYKWDVGVMVSGETTAYYLIPVGIKGDVLGISRVRTGSLYSVRKQPDVYEVKGTKKKEEVYDERKQEYRR